MKRVQKPSPKASLISLIFRPLWAILTLVVWFAAGLSIPVLYYIYQTSQDLPNYASLAKYEPAVMTRVYAYDGSLIGEYARERRIFMPISSVPKLTIAAFLSAEDRRFYEHGGIDYQGILRAVLNNLQNFGSKRPEGASTITQQVAKNFLLSNEQNVDRKLKEAMLALRIERTYSKDRILELYLNEIFLGMNSYGVAAAALNYFNKELSELTIEEAAYLAALPKGPSNYHPLRKTKEATTRRDWIIGQMADAGYITAEQATAAKAKPLRVSLRPFGSQVYAADYFAEDVKRTLLANFGEDGLMGRAERGAVSDGNVNGGLTVRTSLNPDLQRLARKALVQGLVDYDRGKGWRGPIKKISASGDWGAALADIPVPGEVAPWRIGIVLEVQKTKASVGLRPVRLQDNTLPDKRETVEVPWEEMRWARTARSTPRTPGDVLQVGDVIWVSPKDPQRPSAAWSLMQIPEIDGGLVAMDPHTGRVLAVVGGFAFAGNQFDRAMLGKRQPGSVFKPLVYAAALDNGYKPTDQIMDEPIEIELGRGRAPWVPKNYEGGSGSGPLTLRAGIEQSRNLMTVRLAQALGFSLVGDYARRFDLYDRALNMPSLALGSGETTLLRMCGAYAVLANGGKQVKPSLIDRIQDRWGRSLWRGDGRECTGCNVPRWEGQAEPVLPDKRTQLISAFSSYQITSIMEGVIQHPGGTARGIKTIIPNLAVAGKTGTTNEEKDAWFVGYTPDLLVGVSVGYDRPESMGHGATGGHLAAPIFANFMRMALAGKPVVSFRVPRGIKFVRVDRKTGERASELGGDGDTIVEAFKPNEEPEERKSVLGSRPE
jgi:penicillin-binding protein 1A